jgi:hypothetical protein
MLKNPIPPRLARLIARRLAAGHGLASLARLAGLADPRELRRLLDADPGFAELLEDARTQANGRAEDRHAQLLALARDALLLELEEGNAVTARWVAGHPKLVRALFGLPGEVETDGPKGKTSSGTGARAGRRDPPPPFRKAAPRSRDPAAAASTPAVPRVPAMSAGFASEAQRAEDAKANRAMIRELLGPSELDAFILRGIEGERKLKDPVAWAAEVHDAHRAWSGDGVRLPSLEALVAQLDTGDAAALPAMQQRPARERQPGIPAALPGPGVSSLAQRLEHILQGGPPRGSDDLDLADAILAIRLPKAPLYAGRLDLDELRAVLGDRPVPPDLLNRLASTAFMDAALAAEVSRGSARKTGP